MDVIIFYFMQLGPGCPSQRKYWAASETSCAHKKEKENWKYPLLKTILKQLLLHYHTHPRPFLKVLAAHAGASVHVCATKCKCSSLISCAGKQLSVCHYSGGFLSWAGRRAHICDYMSKQGCSMCMHAYLGCKLPSIARHLYVEHVP